MQLNLSDIWLFLMGFFLLCYAITDGSNLGVGIISLFSKDYTERGLMMGVVNNTWHGNQTWLVLIGGMLFGAFPVFFAIFHNVATGYTVSAPSDTPLPAFLGVAAAYPQALR